MKGSSVESLEYQASERLHNKQNGDVSFVRRRTGPTGSHVVGLGVLFLWLLLLGGREFEQYRLRRLPGTTRFYETNKVCGLHVPYAYVKELFVNRTRTRMYDGDILFIAAAARSKKATAANCDAMSNSSVNHCQPTNNNKELSNSLLAAASSSERKLYPPITIATYGSAELARSQGNIVQHCGDCGQCSNPQDIAIYDDTKNTLFYSSLQCSKVAFLQGRQAASECLTKAVGFTDGCNECWVDNIMCTVRSCLFTCAWTSMFTKIKVRTAFAGDSPQKLNECLQCDEKLCGPAFLACAGANRRRVGISSDIRRHHREECAVADEDWWKSPSLQGYYRLSIMQEFVTTPGSYD